MSMWNKDDVESMWNVNDFESMMDLSMIVVLLFENYCRD